MLDRTWIRRVGPFIAVALAAAGGLIFDAMTPEMISVTRFFVGAVLVGYWFPQAKAPLVIALLAVPLVIIGYWLAIANGAAGWESWLNRGLSIVTVSLVAVFVWYIRVLEQKLQTGKDRLQFALDAARLGWWQYDPRRRIGTGDTRFKEIFDLVTGQLPIEDIKRLVHPDDAERFWADRSGALDPADPESSQHEYRVQLRGGGIRWVGVRWLAHVEGTGNRRRLESGVGTVWDITERKEHEEREHLLVREMNHRVKNIFAVVDAIAQRTTEITTKISRSASPSASRPFRAIRTYYSETSGRELMSRSWCVLNSRISPI